MDAIVFGNVTLDVICYPVDEVPRHESIAFERAIVSPGGCASNTAMGLAKLGVVTALVARTGGGDAGELVRRYWEREGIDTRFVSCDPETSTGISVGLVDREFQPRFVHTSGANAGLSVKDLDLPAIAAGGARYLHVAGFFVLPGLMDGSLAETLAEASSLGMRTSLDVVFNVRMDDPKMQTVLWEALPQLDCFMCNAYEAYRLTGEQEYRDAVLVLRERGARTVIVKLGSQGCWLENDDFAQRVPAPQVRVVDTTGAGDAFAAGFIAAILRGEALVEACRAGNHAGARIVTRLGAVEAWFH
ncbi:MAG: carbohydrate kinase family protein [Anaerolineales bacterium]|jgi:sugar/nucleoside kinase (ribokinase family)